MRIQCMCTRVLMYTDMVYIEGVDQRESVLWTNV